MLPHSSMQSNIRFKQIKMFCFFSKWTVRLIINCVLFIFSGLVLVTAEGGAHAPHHETSVVHAHAPGKGGGGIAAGPAPAVEAIVTATSRAPDTSMYKKLHTKPTQNLTSKKRLELNEFPLTVAALLQPGITVEKLKVVACCDNVRL